MKHDYEDPKNETPITKDLGKIKFAIVGYGHIGKRHAKIIRSNKEAELVGVCDIDESVPLDQACYYYNNIEDLLTADLNIDVVNMDLLYIN